MFQGRSHAFDIGGAQATKIILQGGAKRMDSLPYYTMLGGYFFLGTL